VDAEANKTADTQKNAVGVRPAAARSRGGVLTAIVSTVVVVTYPAALYFGLGRWRPRTLGLILLALLLLGLSSRLTARVRGLSAGDRRVFLERDLWPVLRVPLSVAGLIGLAAALDDSRFLLILPVLVNVLLLVQFAATLRAPVSLVERFARLQEPELPPGGPLYCRRVTAVWCVFFILNGSVAGILALRGPVAWWALYTGAIAYGLMGLLFTLEFIARKAIFRQFGDTLPDRVLAVVLRAPRPQPTPAPGAGPPAKPTP
jgi:uncharacterized membrane protein